MEQGTLPSSSDTVRRVAIATVAAIAGAFVGFPLGGYLVAEFAVFVDRDIAELKDTLIWGMITGALTSGSAAIWLTLVVMRASWMAQRIAVYAIAVVLTAGMSLMAAAYDWPKSSGDPQIRYELRLPRGTPLPTFSEVDMTLWAGRSPRSVYIAKIQMTDGRPEITGSFIIDSDNPSPVMSLRLKRRSEGRWEVPITPDARLERRFGRWQPIVFTENRRKNAGPLPAGDYEIRYRVHQFR